MKKGVFGVVIISVLFLSIFSISLVSAGWFGDFFGKYFGAESEQEFDGELLALSGRLGGPYVCDAYENYKCSLHNGEQVTFSDRFLTSNLLSESGVINMGGVDKSVNAGDVVIYMHSLYGPNGTLGGEEPTLIAHVPNIHQEIKDLTVCAGDNKYPVIYGILGNLVFNLDVWRPNIPLFIKISGTCNSGGRTRMGPSACLEPSAVITNVNCLQNGKLLLDTDTERRVVYDPETETLEDYPYSGPIFSIPSLSPTGSSLSTIPTSCPVKTETLGSNGKGWGTCSIDGMGVCQSETSCGWTNADGDISQTVSCAQRSPCKCPNTGGQSV